MSEIETNIQHYVIGLLSEIQEKDAIEGINEVLYKTKKEFKEYFVESSWICPAIEISRLKQKAGGCSISCAGCWLSYYRKIKKTSDEMKLVKAMEYINAKSKK